MAERWRNGRVLLAGDAAHMTPQFIGQGMNAGVRDAYNLGWKLHAVLTGIASEHLLGSYEAERRPHVTAMIREGARMKSFVSVSQPRLAALRNAITRIFLRLPWLGAYVRAGKFVPQPYYRESYWGSPRRRRGDPAGKLMPQPVVRGPDGRRHRMDDLFGPGFIVLGAASNPRERLDDAMQAWCDRSGLRFAAIYPWGQRPFGNVERSWPKGLLEMEDVTGEWYSWLRGCRGGRNSVLILRPDRFVCDMIPAADLMDALTHLRTDLEKVAG